MLHVFNLAGSHHLPISLSCSAACWLPCFQVAVLTARTARNWMRNPNLLMSELVQYVFIALFCGEAPATATCPTWSLCNNYPITVSSHN